MFIIKNTRLANNKAGRFIGGPGNRETAIIVTKGGVIHPGLEIAIPRKTPLLPLISTGDEHTYRVTVYGYTMDRFIAIVEAYARKDFKEAERLIREITPRPQPQACR